MRYHRYTVLGLAKTYKTPQRNCGMVDLVSRNTGEGNGEKLLVAENRENIITSGLICNIDGGIFPLNRSENGVPREGEFFICPQNTPKQVCVCVCVCLFVSVCLSVGLSV